MKSKKKIIDKTTKINQVVSPSSSVTKSWQSSRHVLAKMVNGSTVTQQLVNACKPSKRSELTFVFTRVTRLVSLSDLRLTLYPVKSTTDSVLLSGFHLITAVEVVTLQASIYKQGASSKIKKISYLAYLDQYIICLRIGSSLLIYKEIISSKS